MMQSILDWPRWLKRLAVIAMDTTLAVLAMWLAFSLRLDLLHRPVGAQWLLYALAPLMAIPIFAWMGLYRAIFRYTGFAALTTTAKAIGIYALLLIAVLHWTPWPAVVIPRSMGILQPLIFLLICAALVLGMSVFFRVAKVEVVGNSIYTAEEVVEASGIGTGDNLFFINRFSAASRIFSKLPYVDKAKVTRALPNRAQGDWSGAWGRAMKAR